MIKYRQCESIPLMFASFERLHQVQSSVIVYLYGVVCCFARIAVFRNRRFRKKAPEKQYRKIATNLGLQRFS